MRDALRVQADIHLASAATEAAKTLQRSLETNASLADSVEQRGLPHTLVQLLRLSHMRQRQQVDPAPPPVYPQTEDSLESLRMLHPNATVGMALEMCESDSLDEADGRYKARLQREGHPTGPASKLSAQRKVENAWSDSNP